MTSVSRSAEAALNLPFTWQQAQWDRLSEQAKHGKLPHAILLAGPKGIGKSHFAKALGYRLLCQSAVNDTPCGRCKACELNLTGNHPDLIHLHPEESSRAIKIDQVRALTEFLGKTAQQGGYKIAIVEPAEALNINAANALLKSLEEPSGNTLLILVSHLPSLLMATIRSRCQKIDFIIPRQDESLAWLRPLAVGRNPEYLLECAAGAPLTAFDLLDSDTLENREVLVKHLLSLSSGAVSPVSVAADLMKLNIEPLVMIEAMMLWLQRSVRQPLLDNSSDNSEESRLCHLLEEVPQKVTFRFWDKLVTIKRQLLGTSNANKQLLLEELMMDWQALVQLSGVATVGS